MDGHVDGWTSIQMDRQVVDRWVDGREEGGEAVKGDGQEDKWRTDLRRSHDRKQKRERAGLPLVSAEDPKENLVPSIAPPSFPVRSEVTSHVPGAVL